MHHLCDLLKDQYDELKAFGMSIHFFFHTHIPSLLVAAKLPILEDRLRNNRIFIVLALFSQLCTHS